MEINLVNFGLLLGLGFGVGVYGTMVGAGGGFLLTPALLLLYDKLEHPQVVAIALAAVFFNAYGGTAAYARARRIDYAAGGMFAVCALPGVVLGTYLIEYFPRDAFQTVFGLLLVMLGTLLTLQPEGGSTARNGTHWNDQPWEQRHTRLGAIGSGYLGLLSSLLGIGGGVMYVPFLARVLRFRPHVATATSQFVLLLITFSASVAYLLRGRLDESVLAPTAFLALGMLTGAPVGAGLSSLLRGPWLMRLLAAALVLVGMRLMWEMF